jgi:hypothetical protein
MSFWERQQKHDGGSLRDGFRAIRDRHARDTEHHVTASLVEQRTRDFLDEMEAVLLPTPTDERSDG